jgi:hypothetical protein
MSRGEAAVREGRQPTCPDRVMDRMPIATDRAAALHRMTTDTGPARTRDDRRAGRPAPANVPEFTSWADVWGLTRRSR